MNKIAKICAIAGLVLAAGGGAAYGIFFGAKSSEKEVISCPPTAPSYKQQTEIILSDIGITINGNGASVSGSTVTISQTGSYSVSGTLSEGQIYVNADGSDTVLLSLNGVDISNSSDAAIYIENADTFIDIVQETSNCLQSGTAVDIIETEDSSASGGAVYAKDNLYISGSGSLQVFGYINNGIQSSNNIIIDSGKIEVTALNNGIKGKDSVTIYDGEISVRSGGDGIKSDDTAGDGYGVVKICGGSIFVNSDSDGIQAETELEITSGEFSDTSISIISGGGSESAANGSENNGTDGGFGFGRWNWQNRTENSDMDDDSSVSAKGIKCGGNIKISGGSISVDSYDDAVHSNDSISITGGEFSLASGDDGIHADKELTVEGGNIRVTKSYEGLEANIIRLSGGTIDVTASDDGINAYGGQNNFGGFGGSSKTTVETPMLYFSGADVTINANGDGIDSNGSIFVEAGTIIVNGPTNSGNGAIDSGSENGGKCVITGGTILAIGSAGMDEGFSSESSQCSFLVRPGTSISAGSEIIISDSAGNVLFTHTAAKTASSVVFSSPELQIGEKYILSVDGQETEIEQSSVSVGSGGGFGNGFGGGFGGDFGGGFGGRGGKSDRGDRNQGRTDSENPGSETGEEFGGDLEGGFGNGFGRPDRNPDADGGEFGGNPPELPEGDFEGGFRGGFGRIPGDVGGENFGGDPPDGNFDIKFGDLSKIMPTVT